MNIPEQKIIDPDVEANKTIAALSYLWIFCLVPLLWKRESKFAQFHAKQGLILFGPEIIVSLLGYGFFHSLLLLLAIIASAVGFIKTYKGEWWQAPIIYNLSKNIKL